MRKCGRIQNACTHACTECRREMGGGGGHLMGAPTKQKDGLWGQWWAKLPQGMEWQGKTVGNQYGARPLWLVVSSCSRMANCMWAEVISVCAPCTESALP